MSAVPAESPPPPSLPLPPAAPPKARRVPGGLPPGPLPPGVVRASDADRAETVGALRDEFAAGRLSHDTFLYRMNAAMEARHVTDLPPLLADLPPGGQPALGVLGRVRSTWNRLMGRPASPAIPGYYPALATGSEPSRRLTSAMRLREEPSSPPDLAPPAPLPFPRTAEGFFTIGRDSRCDLAIDHMTVSRIHARLERTEAGWTLKDLSSTNGTRVNGWRVRGQVPVRVGDIVRFGDIQYLLTADQGLPQPSWPGDRAMAGGRTLSVP
jgi:hypothetical protein